MAFDFLSLLGSLFSAGISANPILLFVVFIIFIFVVYKLFQLVTHAIVLGVIAALFPWIANWLGNWDLPTDVSGMLWFATLGVGLFIFYAALRFLYGILSAFAGGRTKTVVKKEKKEK